MASLQAELTMVQNQLLNSRFAMANALQTSQQLQQPQQPQHVALMLQQQQQPAYSNSSSASTNFINMSNFASNFDFVSETVPSCQSMEPLHELSRPAHDDEDDEEESQIPIMFANDHHQILHSHRRTN